MLVITVFTAVVLCQRCLSTDIGALPALLTLVNFVWWVTQRPCFSRSGCLWLAGGTPGSHQTVDIPPLFLLFRLAAHARRVSLLGNQDTVNFSPLFPIRDLFYFWECAVLSCQFQDDRTNTTFCDVTQTFHKTCCCGGF
jgi:hypothetical protein